MKKALFLFAMELSAALCYAQIGQKAGPAPTVGQADSLLATATLLIREGSHAEALAVLTTIQQSEGGLNPKNILALHSLLGQCHGRLQQFDSAAKDYERALAANTGGNDTLQAMFHYQLGLNRYRLSEYAAATAHVLQARDLYRKLYGPDDKNHTASLNTLGFLYNVQAKYSEAEKTFQEARQINLRTTGGEDLQYAKIINNLADVYCNLNRYEQAGELYQTSLRIKEKVSGKQSRDYANTLYNLADFQASLGRNELAKNTIREGAAIFTALNATAHPDYLKFLDYLAILAEKTGDLAEAERLYKEALQRREAAGATGRDDYVLNLLNLGHFFDEQAKAGEALPYVEKALPLSAKIYGTSHPTYAGVLTTLANVQAKRGDNDPARSNYEEAIRIVQRSLGKDHIEHFHAQFAYARFLRNTGKKSEAIAIFKKIEAIPQHYLKRAARFLSEKELNEKVEGYRSFSTEICSFLNERPGDPDLAVLAFDATLFYRGFILDNLQHIRRGMAKARMVSDARDEIISLHRQLENELNRPVAERGNTADMERRIMEMESEVARTLGSFAENDKEIHWEDVQLALGEGEAAVEYLAFADPKAGDSIQYGALVLTPNSPALVYVKLCRESGFAALMPADAVRKADYIGSLYAFADRGAVAISEKKASLFDLVWLPLRENLRGAKRVFVVPDGLLNRVALSALPTALTTVVADSVELILLGSTRQVVPDDDRILAYSGKKSLVVGGVNYGPKPAADVASRSNADRKSWEFLPWAEKEGREVAGKLATAGFEVGFLSGDGATEKAVVDTLGIGAGWQVVHIATHGYFSAQTATEPGAGFYGRGMMNSGLVLAGANGAKNGAAPVASEDGLLSAYEVSRMDLSKTELVVLSACETGLGDLSNSEGVYGLQRAFRLAGAGKLVMSLWQVPDRETKDFMDSFYKNWLGDQSTVRAAFQKTQAELRQRFVNPYQWAGFILLE